jgi:hypothetical protein
VRDTERPRYRIDHLIPASLGGTEAVTNLWPQIAAGLYGVAAKDSIESALHDGVCAGTILLVAAQHAIATDWTTARDLVALAQQYLQLAQPVRAGNAAFQTGLNSLPGGANLSGVLRVAQPYLDALEAFAEGSRRVQWPPAAKAGIEALIAANAAFADDFRSLPTQSPLTITAWQMKHASDAGSVVAARNVMRDILGMPRED